MYDLNVTILLIFFFFFVSIMRRTAHAYYTRLFQYNVGPVQTRRSSTRCQMWFFLYIYMQVPRVQSVVYNEFFEQLPERSVSFDVRLKFFRVKNAAHQCSHVISYTISELFSLRTPSPRSHRCRGDRVTSKKMIRHVLPYNKS